MSASPSAKPGSSPALCARTGSSSSSSATRASRTRSASATTCSISWPGGASGCHRASPDPRGRVRLGVAARPFRPSSRATSAGLGVLPNDAAVTSVTPLLVASEGPCRRVHKCRLTVDFGFSFETHPDLRGYFDGSLVSWIDQTDEAREMQFAEAVSEDRPCRLGAQSPPPVRLGDQIRDFHFLTPIEPPRQQPATTDELIRLLEEGRPEPKPVLAVVDVDDPLELLFCLLIRKGALGEVLSDVGVTVDRSKRAEVIHGETPECHPLCLDYVRLAHRWIYVSRRLPREQPSDDGAEGRARGGAASTVILGLTQLQLIEKVGILGSHICGHHTGGRGMRMRSFLAATFCAAAIMGAGAT